MNRAPGAETRAPLRLGTRRSPLALHQAALARDAIRAADPQLAVELVELVSDGDRDPRALRDIGRRGLFAHTLERALLAGEIDAAVHSSKDLPLDDTPGLVLAAWLQREDPRDALVGIETDLGQLQQGAVIATSSARRSAALLTLRPDLRPSPVRGNVQRRIDRALERGDAACMLAMAGLVRLGITHERADVLPLAVAEVIPEAGQGAVVIQARAHVCAHTAFEFASVDHIATRRTVQLERSLARLLGGGCERPVGVHVELDEGRVHAFVSTASDVAGVRLCHELVGLELAPLISVGTARDIDDAAVWCADQLYPQLAAHLGVEVDA